MTLYSLELVSEFRSGIRQQKCKQRIIDKWDEEISNEMVQIPWIMKISRWMEIHIMYSALALYFPLGEIKKFSILLLLCLPFLLSVSCRAFVLIYYYSYFSSKYFPRVALHIRQIKRNEAAKVAEKKRKKIGDEKFSLQFSIRIVAALQFNY